MKLLVLCFLGIAGTTTGTIVCEGTMKSACQTGFMVAAGVTVVLWLLGRFD